MSNGNSARKGPIPRSSGSVPRPQLACAGVKLCDLKPEEVKKQMELHREHYEVVWFLLWAVFRGVRFTNVCVLTT